MLYELNVREGEELSREEIVRKLPDAPDAHIDYMYNLLGDPDALRALYEEPDDEDEDDDVGGAGAGDADEDEGRFDFV